jgi:hypothetical protein
MPASQPLKFGYRKECFKAPIRSRIGVSSWSVAQNRSAAHFLNPVLSELISWRTPSTNNTAFASRTLYTRTNLQLETVRRAGIRGTAQLK